MIDLEDCSSVVWSEGGYFEGSTRSVSVGTKAPSTEAFLPYRSQPPNYNTERKTASEASSGGLGSDNRLVTRGLSLGYGC